MCTTGETSIVIHDVTDAWTNLPEGQLDPRSLPREQVVVIATIKEHPFLTPRIYIL